MDTTFRLVLDNTTEGVIDLYNVTASNDPQAATFGTSKTLSPLIYSIGYTIGFTAGIVGIIANVVVLTVLTRARRQYGSNVNTLIINQSVMDFLACSFVVITMIFLVAGRFVYNGSRNQLLDNAICVFFDAGALAGVCMTAGKVGLMVITLERYFKIVHAIAHRKYYRDWMTRVAVVLPWIGGVCFVLIPSICTTRIIHETCQRLAVWPHNAMASAYAVVRFILLYAVPVGLFIYCYGRIFHTIRRQSKVVAAGHGGRTQDVPMATTSRDQNPGQVQQQPATGAATGDKLSRTEMNVLQTMVAVIICFILFWSIFSVVNFLVIVKIVAPKDTNVSLFATIGFINTSLNPFIYAARYEVFKRSLKRMITRDDQSSHTTATR